MIGTRNESNATTSTMYVDNIPVETGREDKPTIQTVLNETDAELYDLLDTLSRIEAFIFSGRSYDEEEHRNTDTCLFDTVARHQLFVKDACDMAHNIMGALE